MTQLDAMRFLDLLAQRAWPAESTEEIPGWALRHTPCVERRRSNAALPTHPDTSATDESIRAIVEFYTRHSLVPRVQVTPAGARADLDEELLARGWIFEAPTAVLISTSAAVVAAGRPDRGRAFSGAMSVDSSPHQGWLDAWLAISGTADALATYRRVIARIHLPIGYAVAREDGEPAGVGLVVIDRGWAGLFCMVVEPSRRRRGFGRNLLAAAAEWSERLGVQRLYLQVEEDNAAAQTLYAQAGFARSHEYHYRTAPGLDIRAPLPKSAAAPGDAR